MIDLARSRASSWIDVGDGVRLLTRPCTTALMLAARADLDRNGIKDRPPGESILRALARQAIEAWEGVGIDGEPALVTRENIDAVMEIWLVAEAFERLYLAPALLLDDEKNASAPAPNGISVAGPDTAAAAE